MPPSEVTQSASSSASPLPAASGSRSDSTPVEVSAWTAAISFGDGCAASTRSASTGCPHSCSTAHDLGPAPRGDVDHPLPEQAVDRDDDDVARAHGVDERRLHAGRAGGRQRQGAPVRRPEHLPQPVGGLVQDLQEHRVEVPEQRLAERDRRLRVGVGRSGSEQGAGTQRHVGHATDSPTDTEETAWSRCTPVRRDEPSPSGALYAASRVRSRYRPRRTRWSISSAIHAAMADDLLGPRPGRHQAGDRGLVCRLRPRGRAAPPASAATGWPATARASRGACCAATDLRLGPLASVDDAFAWDEGEGDRTRDHVARRAPRLLHAAARPPAARAGPTTSRWSFERFAVVWPPEVAD